VLDNHTVELGAQDKDIALHVARQGWKKLRVCSPRVRYKPRVTLVGKISLAATLYLGSQRSDTLVVVSSIPIIATYKRVKKKTEQAFVLHCRPLYDT
jgi:hypothetical protein